MKRIIFGIICLLAVVCFSTSCLMKMTVNRNTVASGAIPSDFGKTVNTMLILINSEKFDKYKRFHRTYNKHIQKVVEKVYTGPFEIIEYTSRDRHIEKDTNKYRYSYFYDIEEDYKMINGEFSTVYRRKFYIYDYVGSKIYRSRISSGNWGKITKGYFFNLNSERLKAKDSVE